MKSTRLATLCVAFGLAAFSTFEVEAETYTDGTGETIWGHPPADIVSAEVTHNSNNVVFAITLNGNPNANGWVKLMVGIATGKTAGTATGNGWGRPINLSAGSGKGMNFWIGSWTDGSGGAEFRSYSNLTSTWSLAGATYNNNFPGTFAMSASTVTYTISRSALGLNSGDTIYFDVYTSGGGDRGGREREGEGERKVESGRRKDQRGGSAQELREGGA